MLRPRPADCNANTSSRRESLPLRADTTIKVDYLRHGDILPHVLGETMAAAT